MSEENKTIQQQEARGAIDFGTLFRDLLKHKKLYYKVLSVTFVLAVIYSLSVPSIYKCEVVLSPELSNTRSGAAGVAALASNFGVNLARSSAGMGTEALFHTLYPDLMNSVDFKTSLFPIPVTIEGDKEKGEPDRTMTYYDYLKNEQKRTWWSAAIGGTINGIMGLFIEEKPEKKTIDPFRLTKKQAKIVKSLDKRIICDVDQKTMVITIDVYDQNALIAATMADSVKVRLQNFITDYRTSKARVDLDYNKKLYRESKARYEKARQRYAEFVDANHDIILQTVRQRQTDLENEMQLQYNAYTQIASQLLAAEAKVQQETPAFTTLQSATVPVKRSSPRRTRICLIFLFLAFLGTSAYVLHKEDHLKPLLGLS